MRRKKRLSFQKKNLKKFPHSMAQLTNTTTPTTSQAFIILISPNIWSNRIALNQVNWVKSFPQECKYLTAWSRMFGY